MEYTTYAANGMIFDEKTETEEFHISKFNNGFQDIFMFAGDDIFYELEHECINLYEKFTALIFEDPYAFKTETINLLPEWQRLAGIDSDCTTDHVTFNKLIKETNETENKYLFLNDCHALIGSLQSRIANSRDAFINFYTCFCKVNPDKIMTKSFSNTICWTSGGTVQVIFSILSELFSINNAILDLFTKIAVQLEKMPKTYDSYPKMSAMNITYGDKSKIKIIGKAGTIFETTKEIKTFMSLRNELIHNGTWEQNPKLFIETKDSIITNKFIHQPDMTPEGTLISVKNRKRFFNQGLKINETLPALCSDFWKISLETLKRINAANYK